VIVGLIAGLSVFGYYATVATLPVAFVICSSLILVLAPPYGGYVRTDQKCLMLGPVRELLVRRPGSQRLMAAVLPIRDAAPDSAYVGYRPPTQMAA
jgi:hypothetical protein